MYSTQNATCEASLRTLGSSGAGKWLTKATGTRVSGTPVNQGTMVPRGSLSTRNVVGCILLMICGAERAVAQTLQCPSVGSNQWPTLPDSHSCAEYFGSSDSQGTRDGQGLCAIMNLGLQDGCGVDTASLTDAWWTDHLVCTAQTANCKTTTEITDSSSRAPLSASPALADACYNV